MLLCSWVRSLILPAVNISWSVSSFFLCSFRSSYALVLSLLMEIFCFHFSHVCFTYAVFFPFCYYVSFFLFFSCLFPLRSSFSHKFSFILSRFSCSFFFCPLLLVILLVLVLFSVFFFFFLLFRHCAAFPSPPSPPPSPRLQIANILPSTRCFLLDMRLEWLLGMPYCAFSGLLVLPAARSSGIRLME